MIECVPNFSEGRDRTKVEGIAKAMGGVAGVRVLGFEFDADHHRSVVTIAGPVDAVTEAAIQGVGRAAELIDLRQHQGVHPRVGAADVVPFVPLEGSTMEDCIAAAHHAGEEIWKRFGVPAYFYGAAARTAARERLEKTRRIGFDGNPPDVGTVSAHPASGASMVGARGFLVAYNVYLSTPDAAVAQAIAREIRESSGGFRHVKAIGLHLDSQNRAQVSMNLTNFAETDLNAVYEAIEEKAQQRGVKAGPGELIGFIPRRAYELYPAFFDHAANFERSRIIEEHFEPSAAKSHP